MKKLLLSFIITVLVGSSAFAAIKTAVKTDSKPAVGRYQLFEGTYSIGDINTNKVTESKDIFKIDTATGKTWVYMTGIDENQLPFEFWRLIEEKKQTQKTE